MVLRRARTAVGAALVVMSLPLVLLPSSAQASAGAPQWKGPAEIVKQGPIGLNDARLVPTGGESVFAFHQRDTPGTAGRSILAASSVADGRASYPAITGRDTVINDLRVPERGSAGGFMAAWLGGTASQVLPTLPYYATAFYDGSDWGQTTIHVQQGDSTSLQGFDITQDAQGNVTLMWRVNTSSCPSTCFTYASVYLRSFVDGAWQEPVRVLDSATGDSGRFDTTEPQITSLASGSLLACTDWRQVAADWSTGSRELRCWSSPGAGRPWTALPAVDAPAPFFNSQWSPLLLGASGVPALVHAASRVPAVSYLRGGTWSAFTAIAPQPDATDPDSSGSQQFIVAEDGRGSAHIAMVWLDRAYTPDAMSAIHAASGDDKGWTKWHALSPVKRMNTSEENRLLGISAVPGALLVTWAQGLYYDTFPEAALGLYSAWRIDGAWSSSLRIASFDPTLDAADTSIRYQAGHAALSESGKAAVSWYSGNSRELWRVWTTAVPDEVPREKLTAPTSLSAVSREKRITLGWAPPASGASSVTGYQWRMRADRPRVAWTPWKSVGNGAAARAYVVRGGVRPGQAYVVQVRAVAGTRTGMAASVRVTAR